MGKWQLDGTQSDTAHFVDGFVKKLPPTFCTKRKHKKALAEQAGYGKLAFMNHLGRVTLINAANGHWKDGCWYSNSSYRTYSYSAPPAIKPKAKIITPTRDPYKDWFNEPSTAPKHKNSIFTYAMYEQKLDEHFNDMGMYADAHTGTYRGVCSVCREDYPSDQILPDGDMLWCPTCWCHNQELTFAERSGA